MNAAGAPAGRTPASQSGPGTAAPTSGQPTTGAGWAGTAPGRPDGVATLAGLVLEDESVESVLQVVVRVACAGLASVDGAGAALADSWAEGAFMGPDPIRAADTSQHRSGHGPGPDACRRSERCNVDVEPGDERWPEFTRAARAAGVRSVLALPLQALDRAVGSIVLYGRARGAFGPAEVAAAEALAGQAGVTLYNAMSVVRTRLTNHHLEESLASRGLIGQAQGILMASRHWSGEDAWEELRRRSQLENRKLREVAADVVAGHEGEVGAG